MQNISIHNPAKLTFGPGCIDQMITDYLAAGKKRIYILSVEPVIERMINRLGILTKAGVEIKINTSITGEPSFADFERIRDESDAFDPDSIAGIGGGSVMDLAKVIAVFTGTGDHIEPFVGNGLIKKRNINLVCAPTTSGTGSEVSPNSILLDEKNGAKKGIISPFLVPDASYVDPELTLGLPAEPTAYTGIDALTHCIEAFTNKFAHPLTDVLALEGIRLIANNIENACKNGNDLEARTALSLGSMYGGMCLGPVNTAAVHALAYPLGSDYKIAHGLSNAILLPYVMKFNLGGSSLAKYAAIANVLDGHGNDPVEVAAARSVEIVKDLLNRCGIPSSMRELGVKEDALPSMAISAMEIQRLLKNNPRPVSEADIMDIYKTAF